jgi:hypothetical protein
MTSFLDWFFERFRKNILIKSAVFIGKRFMLNRFVKKKIDKRKGKSVLILVLLEIDTFFG